MIWLLQYPDVLCGNPLILFQLIVLTGCFRPCISSNVSHHDRITVYHHVHRSPSGGASARVRPTAEWDPDVDQIFFAPFFVTKKGGKTWQKGSIFDLSTFHKRSAVRESDTIPVFFCRNRPFYTQFCGILDTRCLVAQPKTATVWNPRIWDKSFVNRLSTHGMAVEPKTEVWSKHVTENLFFNLQGSMFFFPSLGVHRLTNYTNYQLEQHRKEHVTSKNGELLVPKQGTRKLWMVKVTGPKSRDIIFQQVVPSWKSPSILCGINTLTSCTKVQSVCWWFLDASCFKSERETSTNTLQSYPMIWSYDSILYFITRLNQVASRGTYQNPCIEYSMSPSNLPRFAQAVGQTSLTKGNAKDPPKMTWSVKCVKKNLLQKIILEPRWHQGCPCLKLLFLFARLGCCRKQQCRPRATKEMLWNVLWLLESRSFTFQGADLSLQCCRPSRDGLGCHIFEGWTQLPCSKLLQPDMKMLHLLAKFHEFWWILQKAV